MTPEKTHDNETEREQGIVVETSRPEAARPPLYQVVLLNDDYTPMEFVVAVLETFFNMARPHPRQGRLWRVQPGSCRK
jgi:ATP-dependent Clp protease adaptor protein ClpS